MWKEMVSPSTWNPACIYGDDPAGVFDSPPGVEKFFHLSREIYRPSRMHKVRVSGRFFDRLNSLGEADIIYSVARSRERERERRIREFLEFLAATLRPRGGGKGGESLSRWEGGRETKQRRDRIFRWLCNSRRSSPPPPSPSFPTSTWQFLWSMRRPKRCYEKRNFRKSWGRGETSVTFPSLPYDSRFLFLEIYIYIYIIFTCDPISAYWFVEIMRIINGVNLWLCKNKNCRGATKFRRFERNVSLKKRDI